MKTQPNFIRRLREQRQQKSTAIQERSSKKKEQWTKRIAIYGAVLSTALSSYTAYNEFRPKVHELEIFVSDIEVNSDIAEYGVAFYNKGDFHEIVGNASSVLGQSVDDYSTLLNWEQHHCFKPVSLKPGESTYIRYVTKFDFTQSKHLIPKVQKQEYLMRLDFDVLSPEHGLVTELMPVCVLVPYKGVKEWDGKADFSFVTKRVKVNFDNARPRMTKGSYPNEEEFSFSTLCTK